MRLIGFLGNKPNFPPSIGRGLLGPAKGGALFCRVGVAVVAVVEVGLLLLGGGEVEVGYGPDEVGGPGAG